MKDYMKITMLDQTIKIKSDRETLKALFKALKDIFPKRYFPPYELWTEYKEGAEIEWLISNENKISFEKIKLSDKKDYFKIRSNVPKPYENEHPYFFLLQVFSRLLEKSGYLFFQDTISIYFPKIDKTVLILGYPHTGKSTIIGLAIKNNLIPITGENTILKFDEDSLKVITGSECALISPKAIKRYHIDIEFDGESKSGYKLVNLSKFKEDNCKSEVDAIFVIYSNFSSVGFDYSKISERKIRKILWMFASSTIKGLDFYLDPLDLSDTKLDKNRAEIIENVSKVYSEKIFEVFGSHTGILNGIERLLARI